MQLNNQYVSFNVLKITSRTCDSGNVCGRNGDQVIIYAWAKDADPLVYPDGVGLK